MAVFLQYGSARIVPRQPKKEGLYFDDLSEASFGNMFRVAKMMEIDTRLLGVIVENELSKRKEFEGLTLSEDVKYYQQELRPPGGVLPTRE